MEWPGRGPARDGRPPGVLTFRRKEPVMGSRNRNTGPRHAAKAPAIAALALAAACGGGGGGPGGGGGLLPV